VRKTFKIVFYVSDNGELAHAKTLYREAEQIAELVEDPPEEFFAMLGDNLPIHGWAEIEDEKAVVFVIFAPRTEADNTRRELISPGDANDERNRFRMWLSQIKPSDFKDE
jgi:hypothetical protein